MCFGVIQRVLGNQEEEQINQLGRGWGMESSSQEYTLWDQLQGLSSSKLAEQEQGKRHPTADAGSSLDAWVSHNVGEEKILFVCGKGARQVGSGGTVEGSVSQDENLN